VGTKAPVAFFAYPGKPSALSPPDCEVRTLVGPAEDIVGALEALAEGLGACGVRRPPPVARAAVHHNPDFKLMAKCTELRALQVALSLIAFHDDFRDINGWNEGLWSMLGILASRRHIQLDERRQMKNTYHRRCHCGGIRLRDKENDK
jgi:hypothetical protein